MIDDSATETGRPAGSGEGPGRTAPAGPVTAAAGDRPTPRRGIPSAGRAVGTAGGPGHTAGEDGTTTGNVVEVGGRRLRLGGLVPPVEALGPAVGDRVGPDGFPGPELRAELRRIPTVRNVVAVVSTWAEPVALAVVAVTVNHPVVWVAAFGLMGRTHARMAILAHEAAHRLLFPRRALNDLVGRWLLGYPGFTPTDAYRRSHMAHHRDELGPAEPDLALYADYPVPPASLRRKLIRDATGISGWKNLRGLFRALRSPSARPVAVRILATQVVLAGLCAAAGHPWLYPVLWLGPHMTVWRVLNRLRAIAEHGGATRSPDRRLTTHHVRQGFWARFWMVPFNTGYHLAHHVDPGVPWRNLPRLHAELERAGWVTPAITWPGYLALWRALASRGPRPWDGLATAA